MCKLSIGVRICKLNRSDCIYSVVVKARKVRLKVLIKFIEGFLLALENSKQGEVESKKNHFV